MRLAHSHFPATFARSINENTNPPISAGEIVFSSTKITLPCDRPSSAQNSRNGGMVRSGFQIISLPARTIEK